MQRTRKSSVHGQIFRTCGTFAYTKAKLLWSCLLWKIPFCNLGVDMKQHDLLSKMIKVLEHIWTCLNYGLLSMLWSKVQWPRDLQDARAVASEAASGSCKCDRLLEPLIFFTLVVTPFFIILPFLHLFALPNFFAKTRMSYNSRLRFRSVVDINLKGKL